MIRVKGRYREGRIDLEQPIDVPDGAPVEVTVQPAAESVDDEWRGLGMDRLEQEWDNDRDAVYDDWRRLYGVQQP
jgi:hypothetical protein